MASDFLLLLVLVLLPLPLLLVLFRASLSSSSSSSSSSAAAAAPGSLSSLKKYDVFISFRGEDTRKNFTSHLYKALCDKGIETYIDENCLDRGDEITPALLDAINQSNIAVVVFSQDYASSSWCLRELVHILKCREEEGQIVLPVFYHVDPSDIRKQKGSYGEAFKNHEKRFKNNKDEVRKWRSALEAAANLSGWDSKDRVEAKLLEDIVECVSSKLENLTSSDGLEGLIGIKERIVRIKKLLNTTQSTYVRVVGMYGMGGLGKTTIAGVVFNQLYPQFNGSCFLANVREEAEKLGIRSLRDKLLAELLKDENIYSGSPSLKPTLVKRLRRKRLLIVLDDVNDYRQFEDLAGNDWYGPESRIIVTTRDLQLLTNIDARENYEVKKYEIKQLDYEDALELFRLTAFKGIDSPGSDYVELPGKVVPYAGGVPLVIKTWGSWLRSCILKGKQWEMTIETLKDCSPENAQKNLEISYNGLNKEEKAVFLDIACFFKGTSEDDAVNILKILHRSANWLIENLIEKSLITRKGYEKQLWMHDLLQEMGWEVVRKESKMLGKRSRLWIAQEVCDVLEDNKGTEAIEKIILNMDSMVEEIQLSAMVFRSMSKLKLLKVYSFGDTNKCKVYFPDGLQSIPRALKYLEWPAFPSNSLLSNSKSMLRNLVELKMPHSQLEQLWDGSVVQPLVKLKRIDLSHSKNLTQFPNLSGAAKLEIINFEHCTSLRQVPSNHLPNFDRLIDVNLSHCTSLSSLPDTIDAVALKVLKLNGCSSLTSIPWIRGTRLEKLCLDSTPIKELPSSIGSLSRLSLLSVENCKCLESLPSSIYELEFIESVSLFGCSLLENIPELPKNTKELVLNGSAIKEIPSSTESLFRLKSIALSSCQRLESLPSSIFKLRYLTELVLSNCSNLTNFPEILEPVENIRILRLGGTGIKQLPSSIHNLTRLRHLDLSGCNSLEGLPNKMCTMHSLQILNLSNCSKLNRLSSLSGLTSLESLDLSGTSITQTPRIKRLSKLQFLYIKNCKNLQSLTELPPVLEYLNASECPLLETFSNSEKIRELGAGCDDYHIREESVVSFLFYGCLKLDSDDLMINFRYRVLRKALRYEPDNYLGYIPSVNCCWPGSEVPEWFNYRREGSSIDIKLPPQWNDTDLLGFVVCVVASGDYYPDPVELRLSSYFCLSKSNYGKREPVHWRFNGGTHEDDVPTFNSPHVFTWFQYQMYDRDVEEASFEFYFDEWINKTYVKSRKTKVLRCGIRLLYRLDGEEFGFKPHNLYLIDGPTDNTSKPESSGSGRVTVEFDLSQRMIRYS